MGPQACLGFRDSGIHGCRRGYLGPERALPELYADPFEAKVSLFHNVSYSLNS